MNSNRKIVGVIERHPSGGPAPVENESTRIVVSLDSRTRTVYVAHQYYWSSRDERMYFSAPQWIPFPNEKHTVELSIGDIDRVVEMLNAAKTMCVK